MGYLNIEQLEKIQSLAEQSLIHCRVNGIEKNAFIRGYFEGYKAKIEKYDAMKEALEKIMAMKLENRETDYKYAFNRCWHIADKILNQ